MSKYGHFGPSEVDKNVKLDLDEIFRTGVGDIGIFLHCYYELEFTIGQMFADSDQSCYPNASFSVLQFVAQLRLIKNWCGQSPRFLDVGCGLGSKVGIALSLGFDAYGLEINPYYAEVACGQIGRDRVLCTDALGFHDYGKFDVVYFYNPMVSDQLEEVIMSNVNSGAIVYHAIKLHRQPKREFTRLTPCVLRLTDQARNECRANDSAVVS